MSLGERIKERRKACGISQEKLAELVGVSRQAVTKWETGQSAPSTENLLRLAEILSTNAETLLSHGESADQSLAEQIYCLQKKDEEEKTARRLSQIKTKLLTASAVLGGYAVIYLLGRIFAQNAENATVLGWLFGPDPKQLSYLYGWLLHNNLFFVASLLSVLSALLGKYRFAWTTLSMFGIGLLLGEICGKNPAGAAWGQGHFGWAIWAGICIFSFVMGVSFERMPLRPPLWKSRAFLIRCAAALAGILVIILLIRLGIPDTYGH